MTNERLAHLVHNPRPMSAEEAARLLGISTAQLIALNLPVTKSIGDVEVYDSRDVLHWFGVQKKDPRRFEERIAGFPHEVAG